MRVFLFRGLFGRIFSRGMDTLAIRLRKEGHVVSVHSWGSRVRVQEKAIKQFKTGKMKFGPLDQIMIGGHSLGGNSANYMTHNLAKVGVPVYATFTWDATEPMAHAGGGAAHNFMSSDFRAEVVPGAMDHAFDNLHHTQIDKARVTHDLVVQFGRGDASGG